MQPQNNYLKPSLPALHFALNLYLITITTRFIEAWTEGSDPSRYENLVAVAIALGMAGLLFLFAYFSAKRRLQRGETEGLSWLMFYTKPTPEQMPRIIKVMVYGSIVVLFICIFATRYLLRLSDDWNIWWSLGASAVYTALIGALMYWHYIWKPEKEAHE